MNYVDSISGINKLNSWHFQCTTCNSSQNITIPSTYDQYLDPFGNSVNPLNHTPSDFKVTNGIIHCSSCLFKIAQKKELMKNKVRKEDWPKELQNFKG